MKKHIVSSVALLCLVSAPAYAQLGGLGGKLRQAQGVKEKADKIADLKMSDKEERQLGEQVSQKLRQEFGVYQNKDVTKYVSLVGNVLALGSSRPALDWEFIVLDTDGVNAFAAPGGIVHITRGALGLIKNEAELAGVLGHEITHVTAKHTVRSIQKSKVVSLTADEAGGSGGLTSAVIARLAEAAYKNVINNSFDRDDEMEADRVGVTLASKAGYAPGALADVLTRIADRNKDSQEPNGLFASHPVMKDRLAAIPKIVKDGKLSGSATVAARYKKYITFDAKPVADIPVIAGSRGLTGGSPSNDDKTAKSADNKADKKEEPKKKGGLFGKVGLTSGSQAQNTQTVASAGSRGLGNPDRDARGGSNPNKLNTPVSASELAEFKKGIA
jgi:predicted Zn-dependent protease